MSNEIFEFYKTMTPSLITISKRWRKFQWSNPSIHWYGRNEKQSMDAKTLLGTNTENTSVGCGVLEGLIVWLAYYSIFGLKEQWKFARKQKRTSCVLAYLLPFWQLFDHCRWRMNWGLFCKKTFKMYWPSRPRWIWPLDSTRLCTNSQPPTTLSLNRLSNKLAGSPSFVVMWGDSRSKGCGLESHHRILDGHF